MPLTVFVDEVANYRQYDEDGNQQLGRYGEIFEQEYIDELNNNQNMFDQDYMAYLGSISAHATHAGYFSIDKKGHSINSTVKRGSDQSDDTSAYDLILKTRSDYLVSTNLCVSSSPTQHSVRVGTIPTCSRYVRCVSRTAFHRNVRRWDVVCAFA